MKINSITVAALAIASSAVFANTAKAQDLNSKGWQKVCSDQGKSKICNVQYQAVASTGQVVASVNLAEITGEVQKRVFQITVSTDRRIPPGVEIVVDDKKPTKIPFTFCTNTICAADKDLDDKLVAVLKGGAKMQIASVNYEGVKTPIDISLAGFPEAFDGPPIKQEDLTASQQELEKQISNKAKTLAEKLQEAQDKAKEKSTE